MSCINKERALSFLKRILLFSILFLFCTGFVTAQRTRALRIRVGSLFPGTTGYQEVLSKAAADIAALSGNEVEFIFYKDNQGNYNEMLEQLRQTRLQAMLIFVLREDKSYLEVPGCHFLFKNDISALVVSDVTWSRIPEKYKQGIIQAFKQVENAILQDRSKLIRIWEEQDKLYREYRIPGVANDLL